jgi:exonuclease SbcC
MKQLEASAKKLDQMVFEIRDFDQLKADLEGSMRMVDELSAQSSDYEAGLSGIRKELDEIESKLKEATTKKQQFEIFSSKWQDYGERKMRIDQLLREKGSLSSKIAELESKVAGRDLAKMQNILKEATAKERELEAKSLGHAQLIAEKSSRLGEHESKMAEMKRHGKDIEKLDSLIKDLKIFGKALEETQVGLRTEFVEAVNITMSNVWQNLYPYKDFIGVNLSIDEGDYVLQLKERSGRLVNADGAASGGERSIACLALRIAFSLVLAPQLKWLVLDEPTHNLDSKAVEDLAVTLRNRITELVDQIFLITHEERLEDAVTGSLYRLERDKANDDVTRVVSLSSS